MKNKNINKTAHNDEALRSTLMRKGGTLSTMPPSPLSNFFPLYYHKKKTERIPKIDRLEIIPIFYI
jgi:hypothetical protein